MGSIEGLGITRAGAAQIFRFERPEKKNALKSEMYTAIREALIAGDADPEVVAHMFIGSGGVFTAGNDINEFAKRAEGDTGLSSHVQAFIRHLPLVQKPMVAAVDGLAVGIGTTLLLHCDLVYATPSASLRTPFIDLALVPEAGSSLLAPLRLGHARAFELLVLGEPMTAVKAEAAGLVNAVVAPDVLEATALAAIARLAAKPPAALALSRRMLRGDPSAVAQRIDDEIRIFTERLSSPEAREAFLAFFEKRKPDFSKFRQP
ncbi:MAG: crotonase/enoyl-CoA hydratase family protein [Hyphomicrobiaceae bacterium]